MCIPIINFSDADNYSKLLYALRRNLSEQNDIQNLTGIKSILKIALTLQINVTY